MQLAHHLYAQTPKNKRANTNTWMATLHATFVEAGEEMHTAWQSFSATQQRVVSVIAGGTIKLNSTEAASRFGLTKSGTSTGSAIAKLERDGHILPADTTATGWRLTDPLFDLWVRNGRSWPE
jgi:hypothetical protein